jgi:hypothetical protein
MVKGGEFVEQFAQYVTDISMDFKRALPLLCSNEVSCTTYSVLFTRNIVELCIKPWVSHCQNTISGYHSNENLSVKIIHEHKFCSRSQRSEKYFASVYHVYSVSTDNILMWICEYKGFDL